MKVEVTESDWKNWRRQGIGSSDVAAIMGMSKYRTAYDVYKEKVEGFEQPENPAMARGKLFEPVARKIAEELFKKSYPATCHVFDNGTGLSSFARASLDGESDDEILEIKVPGAEVFENCKKGIVPDEYMIQMQWQMLVAGKKSAIFFCYKPDGEQHAHCMVPAHDKTQQALTVAATAFWKLVKTKTPPELTEGDYVEVKDEGFKTLAENFLKAKAAFDLAESNLKTMKSEIEEVLVTINVPGIKGFGVSAALSTRKGNVDYAKIPELENVDLEKYRKAPISVFTVRALK